MTTTFTIALIDFQKDFSEAKPTDSYVPRLPVPGSLNDALRVASLIQRTAPCMRAILATFDSHGAYGIERPGFWRKATGEMIQPFTTITLAQVKSGEVVTVRPEHADVAMQVVTEMEASGRYSLFIWTPHCIEGSIGAALQEDIQDALDNWEVTHQHRVVRIFKGRNPFTEHFSAVKAAVKLDHHTDVNEEFVTWFRKCLKTGVVLAAGQASTHCVPSTFYDLAELIEPALLRNLVLLTDGMSAVQGFEQKAVEFFAWAKKKGIRLMTCAEAEAMVLAA